MSGPYPPTQPPKKFTRSTRNKVIGGVCGGLADYLNMDPTLVRVLTVVISLFTGVPVIAYIVALLAVPEEQPGGGSYPPANQPPNVGSGYGGPAPYADQYTPYNPTPQYAPQPQPGPAASAYGSAPAADAVWGTEGAPWEQRPAREPTPSSSPAPDSTPAQPGVTAPASQGISEWESAPAAAESSDASSGSGESGAADSGVTQSGAPVDSGEARPPDTEGDRRL